MARKAAAPPPFQTYLDDLNSSTDCCRSASILVPAQHANDILQHLRNRDWLCQSVLTRPWRKSSTQQDDTWYYQYLPTEDELQFLNSKHALSMPSTSSFQTQVVEYHIHKSLLVPLTDNATEIILKAWFEDPSSVNNDDEEIQLVLRWLKQKGIMIVHNCDGNQTVSLFKEKDCFPESLDYTKVEDSLFTFADLFAGIGGFRIGMESLGGKCSGSCEIDAYARETYHNNFQVQNEFFVNDISRLDILPATVDVLCGGFPCQSFSTMASFPSSSSASDKSASEASTGTSNYRQGGLLTPAKGKLFFHLLRILRKSQPKMFVFENVKGLLSLDGGSHFKRILQLLEESGYHVTHGIVDAAWMLPQRRERVYFVGVRRDLSTNSLAFTPEELKERFQIYDNDLDISVDKFVRLLQRSSDVHSEETSQCSSSINLSKSRIGDILEPEAQIPSHCFLTKHQWQKIQAQTYLQIHNDGAGQLITEEEPCSQTLVSSYRQSYLLHSQFVVSKSSSYMAYQQSKLRSVALAKTRGESGINEDVTVEETPRKDEQLPRFFSPREW
jgi:DNA-cytosine methyltransferase